MDLSLQELRVIKAKIRSPPCGLLPGRDWFIVEKKQWRAGQEPIDCQGLEDWYLPNWLASNFI
jgi:hypothetical protein